MQFCCCLYIVFKQTVKKIEKKKQTTTKKITKTAAKVDVSDSTIKKRVQTSLNKTYGLDAQVCSTNV